MPPKRETPRDCISFTGQFVSMVKRNYGTCLDIRTLDTNLIKHIPTKPKDNILPYDGKIVEVRIYGGDKWSNELLIHKVRNWNGCMVQVCARAIRIDGFSCDYGEEVGWIVSLVSIEKAKKT